MSSKKKASPLKAKPSMDFSTEEKIKEAARVVFTRKGFMAAKVRDIAAEADINLSLVNYYFRSKEKLFELIMTETIQVLFEKIHPIIENKDTGLFEKIELITGHYIDLLVQNQDFPLFIISEIMSGSNKLPLMTQNGKIFMNSHFAKQLRESQLKGKTKIHPLQLLLNLIGMIVFPFLARPLIIRSNAITSEELLLLVEERKKLIPIWMKLIITS